MVRKIPYEEYEKIPKWKDPRMGQFFVGRALIGLGFVPVVIYLWVHLVWKYPAILAIALGVVYFVVYCFVIIKYIYPNRIVILPQEKPSKEEIERKRKHKENIEAFQNYLEKTTDESDEEDEIDNPLEPL